MQNVPRFLRGPFRRSVRVALEEILKGARTNDAATEEKGWKVFLLLPRMLFASSWARRNDQQTESDASRGVSSRIDPSPARSHVCIGRRSPQQELEVCQARHGRRSSRNDGGTSPTSARPSERSSVVLPSWREALRRSMPQFVWVARLRCAGRKTDGIVRGMVAGDVVRRVVARTMSQRMLDAVQQAKAPFQCTMATKAGCVCLSHVLHSQS